MSRSGTRNASPGPEPRARSSSDAKSLPTTGLPALWQAGFERHWAPIDEGGGEFITATFGTTKALPRKPQPMRQPQATQQQAPPLVQRAAPPTPSRFWASMTLVLTVLTILFAASLTAPMP